MSEQERVLFVHAHPDDETIATGGTLATLVDAGARVTVLTCTRGERGEVIPPELHGLLDDPAALADEREHELAQALAVLGVEDHRFLGASDARWAGRAPRRYLDSGMRWAAPGEAAAPASLDAESLSAAEFGEVAADVAAVIIELRPDAVVSYDDHGGYGHPDHIRAHDAARRAAEVYEVPFYEILTRNANVEGALSVDVSPVIARKREALRQYRTQVTVGDDFFALSNGERQPIDRVERFARVRSAATSGTVAFRDQGLGVKAFVAVVSLAVGLAVGAILTVAHQASATIFGADVPTGLIAGILISAAFVVGTRVAFDSRIVPGFLGLGLLGAIAILAAPSQGGAVLVPANAIGIAWTVAPTAIVLLTLAWPRIRRGRAG